MRKLFCKKKNVCILCSVIFALMFFSSCGVMPDASGSEGTHMAEDKTNGFSVEVSTDEESRLLRSLAFERNNVPPDTVPEDLGVTLELVQYSASSITLLITNGSDYAIRYGDGYEITGKTWGSMGTAGNENFDLPSGESREITLSSTGEGGFRLVFGEFRLTIVIEVEPDNPSNTKTYQLHADFAIENTEIPRNITDTSIRIDFATPIGAFVEITNGFDNGRVFYDKSYRIQRNEGGNWHDVSVVGSDAFPNDNLYSIAPRQMLQHYSVYWAWLYGDLPPGEYRLEKIFFHRSDDGEISKHRLYAGFILDGEPIPDEIERDGSSWGHWFSGISTFRAKVNKHIEPYFHHVSLGNMGMLVESLSPLWDGDKVGDPFYIWDNQAVTVLDSSGAQIKFSDIPKGATVDITFSGIVLQSIPAHISGSLLIQIVE